MRRLFTIPAQPAPDRRSYFGADVGEIKSACSPFPLSMEVVVKRIRTKVVWLARILKPLFFFTECGTRVNNEGHICCKFVTHFQNVPLGVERRPFGTRRDVRLGEGENKQRVAVCCRWNSCSTFRSFRSDVSDVCNAVAKTSRPAKRYKNI